jgi:NhaA family Na+:H+ antiporter
LLAAVVLLARNRQYKLAEEEEKLDSDDDGIPDVYQSDIAGRDSAR